jgi:hypothetical protein
MMSTSIPALDTDRLAGLVFELASQLQAERMHRLALETALARAGVIHPEAVQRLAKDPALRDQGRHAADESVARLMHIITEREPARVPPGE